jgi:hypothetical protein
MKLILLTLLLSPIFLQTGNTVEWLTPMEHDFGDIEQGKPVEFHFKFKNITEEPFVIDNVRTTCGCTASDWSDIPVAASDSSAIKITFDAYKTGWFRKKIKVYFSGQRKAEILYIEGYVLEENY